MLDRIRELAVNGHWQDVIEQGGALLASDHGLNRDDVAWVHLTIGASYVNTAQSGDAWRTALDHATTAYGHATPGGMRHTAAMQQLSSILVDMGRPGQAKWFAQAYLKAAPKFPALAGLTPYVVRDLGLIAEQERRFTAAARYCEQAQAMFAAADDCDEASRTATYVAWAYIRAGRITDARRVLPDHLPAGIEYLRHGAECAILYAEGSYSDAIAVGKLALAGHRAGFDFADAAEVSLYVAYALRKAGALRDSLAFTIGAADFAARQSRDASALLALTLRVKGGDSHKKATAARGSDLHDLGCFTTGVA